MANTASVSSSAAGKQVQVADGVHSLVPRSLMPAHVQRYRDAYEQVPGAVLYRKEFWLMEDTLANWRQQGLAADADLRHEFQLDHAGDHKLGQLGWCEAALVPVFDEQYIEDRGDAEVICDHAGRHVLFFKGRRSGFMPEYIDHPVKDQRSWEEKMLWRLDPETPQRYHDLERRMQLARAAAATGQIICQNLIGGYMFLRSLIGPETLLYMFYDNPQLIHACMQTWLRLADAVTARHQQYVSFDEVFLAEDICYNCGPLISPEMMREFLLPYYQQLISNIRHRQIDKQRHLYIQIDTDGKASTVIDIYKSIGMDVMSPFEVASGSDVVAIGRNYPDLIMTGGIDKRVLATTTAAIDAMLERIIPVMRARGGYIPTVDHGTPAEVPLANYRHYRKRLLELGGV